MALSLFPALVLLTTAVAFTPLAAHPTTPADVTSVEYLNARTDIDYNNISSILATFPEFMLYNAYLTQTRVADEINTARARPDGITCLVFPNPAMSALAAGRPLSAVKAALRSLTLMKYYDPEALRGGLLENATAVAPTLLLQPMEAGSGGPPPPAPAAAVSKPGGMIISVRDNGFKKCVAFRPSAEPGNCSVFLTRPVAVLKENRISVLEVTRPAALPRVLDAALPPPDNLTAALEDAEECGAFAALVAAAPLAVTHAYEAAYRIDRSFGGSGGLTVFVPTDEALRGNDSAAIGRLSRRGIAKLLMYHAVPEYYPEPTLRTVVGRRVSTLLTGGGWGGGGEEYDIAVTACGNDVCLDNGHGRTSRVTSTVLDSPPLCVLAVDSVLMPADLFNTRKPVPAPPAPSPTETIPNATSSNGDGATNSSGSSPSQPIPAAANKPIAALNATAPPASVRTPSVPTTPPQETQEEETGPESGCLRATPAWMTLFAAAVTAGVVVISG